MKIPPRSALVLSIAPLALGTAAALRQAQPPPLAVPGTLPTAEVRARLADPAAHLAFVPAIPLGLDPDLATHVPADNPLTPAKVELGRQLYFDPRLSKDGTVACATCHHPSMGWAENKPVSTGIGGQKGGRSAPTVVNRVLGLAQFWDGRAATLEEQALGPIGNPIEMGSSPEEACERLDAIEGYRLQFEAVFGGPATPERIAKALAAFERTLLSAESKLDYYQRAVPFLGYEAEDGDDAEFLLRMQVALRGEAENGMSAAAHRGRELFFGKAQCSVCHVGQDLTDESFHNLGIGMEAAEPDLGRFVVTQLDKDRGAFRTPSVRNIALTAPYMHDGSLATLRDVVEHYDKGGTKNPWLSEKIFPLGLTEQEKQDLVTFLEEALTGKTTPVEIPRLP
jgi:cytochrome c peroxidase